jgi:hypothetical protein
LTAENGRSSSGQQQALYYSEPYSFFFTFEISLEKTGLQKATGNKISACLVLALMG